MSSKLKKLTRSIAAVVFLAVCLPLIVLIALCNAPAVLAQVTTASLGGTVLDPSKAVVAQAHVALLGESTGTTRETESNAQGAFSFSAVPSGDYTVTIAAPGFELYKQTGIHLDPQDVRVLRNLHLVVGSESSSVSVSAAQSGINTDSGEISSLISAEDMKHLAIEGRDVTELLKTLPGFTPARGNGSVTNSVYDPSQVSVSGAVGQYAGNGTPLNGVALLSDGADITDPGNFGATIQAVNWDQVAEVKVQTSSMTADAAHGPIVMNVVGAYGGNHFHGSLYTYARTNQLNSTDWFSKYTGQSKPPDRQVYPGFTFGGPVRIPGSRFNEKGKLVFWIGAEQYAQKNAYAYYDASQATVSALVPTKNMRNGDFSDPEIAQYLGAHYQSSGNCDSDFSNLCSVPVTAPDGSAIDNGQIGAYLDPGAKALMNVLPLPNAPTGTNYYNYITTNLIDNDLWQARGRIDYALGEKTKIFAVYSTQRGKTGTPQIPYYSPSGPQGGANTPGGGMINTNNSQLGSFNIASIFTPTLTNEVYGSGSYLLADFGNKTPNAVTLAGNDYPYQSFYSNGNTTIPQLQDYGIDGLPVALFQDVGRRGVYAIKWVRTAGDNLSKQAGNHTLRAGVFAQLDSNNEVPTYVPTNGAVALYYYPETMQPYHPITGAEVGPVIHNTGPVGSYSGGNYLANFAEGNLFSYSQTNIAPASNLYFWNIDGYVQDHWRIKPFLSLDFGLRLEHITPWSDAHGTGIPVFKPGLYAADVSSGNALPAFRWHAIDKSVPLSGLSTRPVYVEPRIGMAWDVYKQGATILRAGFGIYRAHDSYNDATSGQATAQGQVSLTSYYTTLAAVSATQAPVNAGAVGTSLLHGFFQEDDEMPQVRTWNVSVVQKAPRQSQIEIAYVGNYSNHILNDGGDQNIRLDDINALPVGALYSTGQYTPADYATVALLQPSDINAFRKYPYYQNLLIASHNVYANYNALQTTWTRQTGSLHYSLNYTWSKALGILGITGNGRPANPFNLHDNYNPETFDRTHVLNATYSYQVGRRLQSKVLGGVVNGWELSGITNLLSGANIVSTSSPNLNLIGNVNGAPGTNGLVLNNLVVLGTPDVALQPRLLCDPRSVHGSHQYINGACFGAPTQIGVNGDYRFPYLHGPGFFNSDLTATKNFNLHDGRNLQLRVAAFNFLNRANNSFVNSYQTQYQLNFSKTDASISNPASPGVLSTLRSQYPDFGAAPLKVGRRILELSLKYEF